MREIEGLPIVDQKLVSVNAHHELHTYLKGEFPDLLGLGETTVQGWTGKETLLKEVVNKPIVIFEVKEGESKC